MLKCFNYLTGEAAGLAYADEILGIQFFHTIYTSSPVVFGSWPSLHAAWPMMIAWFGNTGTYSCTIYTYASAAHN